MYKIIIMDCSICCEKFTKTNKEIQCQYCEFTSCKNCNERYLLESPDDPHCMSCRKAWDTNFMQKTFTSTFMNKKYKEHRENVLLEREKAQLPYMSNDVEEYIQKKKITTLLSDARRELRRLHEQVNNTKDIIYDLERQLYGTHRVSNKQTVKASFKCPMNNCIGFLSDWKCQTCEKEICEKCHEEKLEGHECDEETVETIKAIKKEAKPCPGCGEMVSKVSGCDQMWCTTCHTTFSWNTGEKVHGNVHNPHYFEFMRNNGQLRRNPLDIPCGGVPDAHDLNRLWRSLCTIEPFLKNYSNFYHGKIPENMKKDMNSEKLLFYSIVYEEYKSLYLPLRNLSHTHHIELPRYPATINIQEFCRQKRVLYLVKEITEDTWKKSIYAEEKKQRKIKEFGEILTMYTHTASDLFRQMINDVMNVKTISELVNVPILFEEYKSNSKKLITYVNSNLERVGSAYKCRSPGIDKNGQFYKYYNHQSTI